MKLTGITLIAFSLMVISCGHESPADSFLGGTYAMQRNEPNTFRPSISLNLDDNRFTFTYDPLSSYFNTGTIMIRNGIITAVTDDDEHIYLFEIIDDNTICFIQDGSASIQIIGGDFSIVDGTEFKSIDEKDS